MTKTDKTTTAQKAKTIKTKAKTKNTDTTNSQGSTEVLAKCKQLLLSIKHPP
jgi:hypothetical protein